MNTKLFCGSLLILLLLFNIVVMAQQIVTLHADKPVSLRGLSVVNDNIIWVSGTKGTVGKSVDGGKRWAWMTVPGYDTPDFRDIEAFDDQTAVIIAIAHPAHILRTTDGGKTWKLVYENDAKGMFLDAMDFADDKNGIVVGDPINGKLFVARTNDGGKTWLAADEKYATADSTEGCFASSGTNVRLRKDGSYFFVTGGLRSRIISEQSAVELPFDNTKPSRGANSLAIAGGKSRWMIAVGGDFAADTAVEKNCFISEDDGQSWRAPSTSPGGYRSCVEFISDGRVVTCGLNGVDISTDGGNNWQPISTDSYHACRKAKKGSAVFFSGNNGRIGKMVSMNRR